MEIFWNVRDAYSVDNAIGKQLDVLGKYVGVNRYPGGKPDIGDVGFRQLIKFKIVKNSSKHTMKDLDDMLDLFFPTSEFIMEDNYDMTMTYTFPLSQSDNLDNLIAADVLPKPMGVTLITQTAPDVLGRFGFADYTDGLPADVNGFSLYNGYVGGSVPKAYAV